MSERLRLAWEAHEICVAAALQAAAPGHSLIRTETGLYTFWASVTAPPMLRGVGFHLSLGRIYVPWAHLEAASRLGGPTVPVVLWRRVADPATFATLHYGALRGLAGEVGVDESTERGELVRGVPVTLQLTALQALIAALVSRHDIGAAQAQGLPS